MEGEAAATTGGKRSAWMSHVKKTMKANKGKSLMEVLKMAKKTYKKTAKGGALSPLPLTGARRRGGDEAPEEDRMAFAPQTVRKGGRKTRKAGRKGGKRTRKH